MPRGNKSSKSGGCLTLFSKSIENQGCIPWRNRWSRTRIFPFKRVGRRVFGTFWNVTNSASDCGTKTANYRHKQALIELLYSGEMRVEKMNVPRMTPSDPLFPLAVVKIFGSRGMKAIDSLQNLRRKTILRDRLFDLDQLVWSTSEDRETVIEQFKTDRFVDRSQRWKIAWQLLGWSIHFTLLYDLTETGELVGP